jgi:2-succinyl-5-enolpyruvyl-6-hydroxy-3-cyclohexene-1-carboxylate synthase
MYSTVKSVQILIALLKQHGIRHVVMSSGGACMPIVRSMENDAHFVGYSVVDERSAAYFALGIAQSLKEPVAVVCTSGTAVCNLLSGVSEAFYQGVPIVFITADRHPYLYNQLETQKLNQAGIFEDVTKKSVSLPVVHDDNDFWYCQRLVNEALLALDHHGSGPVHINIPSRVLGLPDEDDCSVAQLPQVGAVRRVTAADNLELWEEMGRELQQYRRILVVFGQNRPYHAEDIANIETFWRRYHCALSTDHLSNLNCEGALKTYPITEFDAGRFSADLLPDLVISLGWNFPGEGVKIALRGSRGKFRHWLINETGEVKDVFKSLSVIFECSPARFFQYFAKRPVGELRNDGVYYNQWCQALSGISLPELEFSNLSVARDLARHIPPNSMLHLSILNSTRQMQLFRLDKSIEVFSNVGALGIDGSLSTFLGQAAATKRLCFLLIGDLSFFYDLNSLGLRYVGSNVRILMVNNHGGGEFHLSFGKAKYPNVNTHIAAEHAATAQAWVESRGLRYLQASSPAELQEGIKALVGPSDRPVFLEAFTNMERDAAVTRQCYGWGRAPSGAKTALKHLTAKVIGQSATDKVVRIAKTLLKS